MLKFINYFVFLNHELGHAKYIEKITSIKYGSSQEFLCKPIIIIGDYEDCIGKQPNHHVMGFDVYSYSKKITKGLTLSPMYKQFSLDEISECAKAGWIREFKTFLLSIFFTCIPLFYCLFIDYLFSILFLSIVSLIISIALLFFFLSSKHTDMSDINYFKHPKEFNVYTTCQKYFSLVSFDME